MKTYNFNDSKLHFILLYNIESSQVLFLMNMVRNIVEAEIRMETCISQMRGLKQYLIRHNILKMVTKSLKKLIKFVWNYLQHSDNSLVKIFRCTNGEWNKLNQYFFYFHSPQYYFLTFCFRKTDKLSKIFHLCPKRGFFHLICNDHLLKFFFHQISLFLTQRVLYLVRE